MTHDVTATLADDPADYTPRKILELFGIRTTAALRYLVRTGGFPQPDLHLGPRSPRWRRSTLERFAARQRQEGGAR